MEKPENYFSGFFCAQISLIIRNQMKNKSPYLLVSGSVPTLGIAVAQRPKHVKQLEPRSCTNHLPKSAFFSSFFVAKKRTSAMFITISEAEAEAEAKSQRKMKS